MGIIGKIIAIIAALPQFFELIMAIIRLIRSLGGVPGVSKKEVAAEFAEALDVLKKTKDPTLLERLHKKLTRQCVGPTCEL